jgi:hypothetical protein
VWNGRVRGTSVGRGGHSIAELSRTNRDRNFTPRKLEARMQQIDESIERYMSALDTADRTEPIGLEAKTTRLQDKLIKLRQKCVSCAASRPSCSSSLTSNSP